MYNNLLTVQPIHTNSFGKISFSLVKFTKFWKSNQLAHNTTIGINTAIICGFSLLCFHDIFYKTEYIAYTNGKHIFCTLKIFLYIL